MSTKEKTGFYERTGTQAPDAFDTAEEIISSSPDNYERNGKLNTAAVRDFSRKVAEKTVERQEIPEGFCGYIDPETGETRIQEIKNLDELTGGLPVIFPYPPGTEIPPPSSTDYPVDECLQHGLAGSPSYTQELNDDGVIESISCGTDDDPVEASGIEWEALLSTDILSEFALEQVKEMMEAPTVVDGKIVEEEETEEEE